MASGGIAERRLRPLWDAIDSRQYKSALKLASALQNKHPDSPYALAAKALVLERLGKAEEALALCRQSKDMIPVDDLTLNTLQIVYQRLGYLEEATQCYENACSKSPRNLELLMALFNSYVRQYDYVKQQQTAMKMYKVAGEEKFLLWAVCSINLQAATLNGGGGKLMALAEAMLKKRIESSGTIDVEALRVYISLLRDQGKLETALEVLSGPLGQLFTIKVDLLRLQGELLLRLERYEQASAIFKEILSISSDDWAAINNLFDATVGIGNDEHQRYARCGDLLHIVDDLQSVHNQDVRRGPWLARVEVENRRRMYNPAACETDHSRLMAVSILAYFHRFGTLASFFLDVKGYLLALDKPSRAWLIDRMREACDVPEPDNYLMLLRRKISVYQVAEYIGSEISVLEIASLYKNSLPYSANLDPQENIYGEELLVIVANYLVKAFSDTKQFGFLLEAVLVLEFGIGLRRFNSRYKLMLVNLYCCICAVTLARNWFKSLEIKNVLLETASHHMLPALLVSPYWAELGAALRESVRFHEDYQVDAAEMTILAYRHCNYSKIGEFVALKEQLARSHHYLLTKVELLLLSVKQSAANPHEAQSILDTADHDKQLCDSLGDSLTLAFNEDFETRPWWSPVPDENALTDRARDSQQCDGMDQETVRMNRWKASLQRRYLLPRLLLLASSGKEGNDVELVQLLDRYLKGFGLASGSLGKFISEMVSFDQVRERGMDGNAVLTASLFWLATQMNRSDTELNEILRSLALVGQLLTGFMEEFTGFCAAKTGADEMISLGTKLSALFMVVSESLAWFTLCIQVWSKRLQPAVRKKKKASENAADEKNSRIVDGLRKLVACITSQLAAATTCLVKLAEEGNKDKIMSLIRVPSCGNQPGQVLEVLTSGGDAGGLLEDGWQASECMKRIAESQQDFLSGVRYACERRLEFFKSLKL